MLTNKGIVAGIVAAVLPVSLAACASNESEKVAGSPSSSGHERPAAPPAHAKPIKASLDITDAHGAKVTLDHIPDRVVCLTGICDDLLISLGKKPVATTSPELLKDKHFLGPEEGSKIPVIKGGFGSEDVGDIASYKPDLVIGLKGVHDGLTAGVEKIAPLWNMQVDSVEDSVDYLRDMAALLDKTAEGEKEENAFYDALRQARQTADEKNLLQTKVVSMYTSSSGTGVNTRNELLGELLANVYAYPWDGKSDDPMQAGQYSVEEILKVNPQIAFVQSFVFAPGDKTLTEQWKDNPVWKQVDAVKNNKVHEVNVGVWAEGRGPRSLSVVLEQALDASR
ncbi:ABC transporter substrate-binding protein [Corynebacterium anserum]|nr:ABC transporter substrate-binding protein [Corynebacterium anserum]MBC2682230.1 ABC transporter substrate-binding protein [Corynebacterium anserum]